MNIAVVTCTNKANSHFFKSLLDKQPEIHCISISILTFFPLAAGALAALAALAVLAGLLGGAFLAGDLAVYVIMCVYAQYHNHNRTHNTST